MISCKIELDLPCHYLFLILASNAGWLRGLIADYGIPLMVVLWTALSYAVPKKVPDGVPRRLVSPLPWEPKSLYHWTVVKVGTLIRCVQLFPTKVHSFETELLDPLLA